MKKPLTLPPNIKIKKFVQVKEGVAYRWYPRKDGSYVEISQCCDCQLVHVLKYTPTKNYLKVQVWRDDEITDKLRAKKK